MNFVCQACNYQMDTQECLEDPSAIPREGDLSICLNCAAVYEMHAEGWVRLSDEKVLSKLDLRTRKELDIIRSGIRQVITEDLSFRQRHKSPN